MRLTAIPMTGGMERRIGPEKRFDGDGRLNHLDVDEREPPVVGARVREAPGPPEPHRVRQWGAARSATSVIVR